jgi:xanthine dehydrogenase large subunit
MGQGVNTRVRQIVADELGVPYEHVIVGVTSTEKNNNTSPTAASSGTDLNGAAAADACRRLRQRLAEFISWNVFCDVAVGLSPSPESIRFQDGYVWDDRAPQHRMTFAQVICRAYIERVNLGERGFYATPGVDFNRETGKGYPFLYYTNGAACSEVLIDRLTGEMKVTRVDLLMDSGKPINPGLDRGQITGGFIQGMGWVTTEELRYTANGELLSHSPTTYKIPNIGDVPSVFNIETLDNPDSAVSLYRGKATGEPPLLLGISVWAAAKNALSYLSSDESPRLSLPATGERLLMLMTQYEQRAEQSAAVPVMK